MKIRVARRSGTQVWCVQAKFWWTWWFNVCGLYYALERYSTEHDARQAALGLVEDVRTRRAFRRGQWIPW